LARLGPTSAHFLGNDVEELPGRREAGDRREREEGKGGNGVRTSQGPQEGSLRKLVRSFFLKETPVEINPSSFTPRYTHFPPMPY